jgi:hypothetical protein
VNSSTELTTPDVVIARVVAPQNGVVTIAQLFAAGGTPPQAILRSRSP